MFYTSQRTIYKADLELAQSLGLEYIIHPNTTLNEKLGILPQDLGTYGSYPKLRYLCIGCGGSGVIDNPTTYPYSYHQPIDASLFKMMPFLVRPEKNDLNYVERTKYRLRKEIIIDGKRYFGYYLKVLEVDKDIIYKKDFYQISKTINPFSFTDRDVLNPTPVSKIDKITSSTSTYINKVAKIVFELTEQELRDVKEVFDLMKNSLFPGYTLETNRTITEIGLCTGIERSHEGYTESACTQVAYHVGVNFDIDVYLNERKEFYKIFNLGGTEPLYME